VNEEKESELAYDAMMKEYDFVASLIRLYRETQMQLVRFGVTLYAATLAFVAGTAHDDGLVEVGAVAAALVAWPIVMLVHAAAVPGRGVARPVPVSAHGEGMLWPR